MTAMLQALIKPDRRFSFRSGRKPRPFV